MALIDYTYFTGPVSIPNTDKDYVQDRLNEFINKYEPEYLKKVLGYDLWKAFMAGLAEPTVDQKWLNLLNGAEYTWYNKTRKWIGFVPLIDGGSISISNADVIKLVADRGQSNDPVSGQPVITLPDEFTNVDISVEERGTGTIDEYTIVGNQLTLESNITPGQTFFLKKGSSITVGVADLLKQSPIANYVYWKWMEDQTTQTVGIGEAAAKAENSMLVSPATKMVRAWNEMIDWNKDLFGFLYTNKETYNWTSYYYNDGWYYSKYWNEMICKTNVFGI